MYWCDLPASAPAVPWSSMLRCFSFSSITPHFGPRVNIYARSASESFARLFKGGGVQGRSPCPRSAYARNAPCAYGSAGGGLRGNPRRGFPLFFSSLCACAPILWSVVVSLSCLSTPFLWCLPKETVSSRQRKALFLPWRLHHPRERCCLGGWDVPRPTWGGAGAGRGLGALRVPFAGGERDRLWPLCAVGQLSGCHCRFSLPPTAKSAFLWGSTPFLCARAKKWGGFARPARSTTQ